jgi:TPR repeat protein
LTRHPEGGEFDAIREVHMRKSISILACLLLAGMLSGQTYSEKLLQRAQSGNAEAQFSLGLCYHFGYGIAANHEEAAKWYLKAAEHLTPKQIEEARTRVNRWHEAYRK